jgi:aryl-alcohol dehydrogenase-like predicted oxidoreductase
MLAGRYLDWDGEQGNYPTDSRAAQWGGIYAERVTPQAVEVGNRFVKLAREYGIAPAQLAMLWAKDQEGITSLLAGPRTLEQLEHVMPVMEMELDEGIRAACDELVPPGTHVANFLNTAGWGK